MEIWKQIEDFPNYMVSNYGRVRNMHGKVLRTTAPHGYIRVSLYRGGVQTKKMVHRLVAKAFIPKIEGKIQVNHKDENKANNRVNNLEWMTPKENTNYGTGIERRRITQMNQETTSKVVIQSSNNGEEIARFQSVKEAARMTGISQPLISMCCNKKIKTAKQYVWNFR